MHPSSHPESLLAALAECSSLLSLVAQRLDSIRALLEQEQHSGQPAGIPSEQSQGNAGEPSIPSEHSRGNTEASGIPPGVSRGNADASSIPPGHSRWNTHLPGIPPGVSRRNADASSIPPGHLGGNAGDDSIPLLPLARNTGLPAIPSVGQLSAVLRRDGFPQGTPVNYIRRVATLLLSLHTDPGKRDLAFFARLMELSQSGVAKMLMALRRAGLIRRERLQVHVLAEKGAALMEAARGYVAPLD